MKEERRVVTVAACHCLGSATPTVDGKTPVLLRPARKDPEETARVRRVSTAVLAAVGSFRPDLPMMNLTVKLRVTRALGVAGRAASRRGVW